jgi:hypothetical protein
MFCYDIEQPNVIYSAEETGHIHRIDLRFNNSKELLFLNRSSCYKNSPIYNDNPYIAGCLPSQWNEPGAVMALCQTATISSPHLVIGGKGTTIGMLDLRITNAPTLEEENISTAPASSSSSSSSSPALINCFVKMWSPLFPSSPSSSSSNSSVNDQIVAKYSQFNRNHPWSHGLSEGDEPISLPDRMEVAISGMDISKDGKRIVASYRNDQIYTFNLKSSSSSSSSSTDAEGNDIGYCDGIEGVIGGHINYATFLKTVNFFGPNDEYVVSGSDSGHLWVWESRSTYQEDKETKRLPIIFPDEEEMDSEEVEEENATAEKKNSNKSNQFSVSPFDLTCCPVVTILKADSRTCNGVMPHPIYPLLASYGIDSDCKLWGFKTVDPEEDKDNRKDSSSYLPHVSDGLKPPSSSAVANKYPFCRHEGVRDHEKFSRISLPLKYHNQSSQCNGMMSFPFVLEINKVRMPLHFSLRYLFCYCLLFYLFQIKSCSLFADRIHHLPKSKNRSSLLSSSSSQVISASDFNDTVYHIRKQFFQQNFSYLQSLKGYETLKKDIGPFMPSDSFVEMLDLYGFDSM